MIETQLAASMLEVSEERCTRKSWNHRQKDRCRHLRRRLVVLGVLSLLSDYSFSLTSKRPSHQILCWCQVFVQATASSSSSASSTFHARIPTTSTSNLSRDTWMLQDGGSSDDGDEDEIESSSDDESLWGPWPRIIAQVDSITTSSTSNNPLQPTPAATMYSSNSGAPIRAPVPPGSSSVDGDQGAPNDPSMDKFSAASQPLQTLQKLQNMLDETDYLTSSPRKSSTATTTAAVSETPIVTTANTTASSTSVAATPADSTASTEPRTTQPRNKLWTSQDRSKYKKQQLKLRRQQEELQQQQRMLSKPSSPPIHPFSDDEHEQMSDDTDDGLGYTLPNVPVYYSDAEGESDGETDTASGQSNPTATSPLPPRSEPEQLVAPQARPSNMTYSMGEIPHVSPPPADVYGAQRVLPPPPVVQQPPYQAYPTMLPGDGVRPPQYYPPYGYPPGTFPYMYPAYGPYAHGQFPSQYFGPWPPPPPPSGMVQHPFQSSALTRMYPRPPLTQPLSPSPPIRTEASKGTAAAREQAANRTTTSIADDGYRGTTSSEFDPSQQQAQPPQPYSSLSNFIQPIVPYDAAPAFYMTPENPQSLAEASSHLNLESMEKISLLLVSVALACYAGVSPRTLPLSQYNLMFYENLRLVSLALIAPAVQILSVFDARENDINAVVNAFFVSFTLGYLLTFATEIVVTTLVRLVVFGCLEPKIFALAPVVPIPVLPWVLRDVKYRPKRITLFAADFATSCVACPIIEEYVKLVLLQWTVNLPRNFNWTTRVSSKKGKKKRTVAEVVPLRPGQKDVLNANKYVTQMLAVSLGLKLCDAGRRILLYTKRDHANKSFFALFRGIFPIHELCGTMTALALAKRDLLGFPTPLWKMLAPAVVIHGMANYRGMKPIFKWNSATPWSEMQLYPLNFADSSTLPQLLTKGFGKFMWFVILGRVLGHCIKNYYLVNRQAVKRTTTYAGKHAAFSAELATAEVLKKQK